MEISNNPETNAQAWNFYHFEKDQDGKLDKAIGEIGNPDYDPNQTQDTSQSST